MKVSLPSWRRTMAEPAAEGSAGWTGGSALAAKAMFVLFVAALLAGPAALAFVAVGGGRSPASAAPKAPDVAGSITTSATAGEAGLQAVKAWLASTSRDPLLDAGSGLRYPVKSDTVTEAHVARVSSGPTAGSFVVLVAVPSAASVAYFSVPVMVGEESTAPMGLPAPVPAPALSDPLRLSYDVSDLSTSVPLSQAVAAVVDAYAKGEDLTRYSSPGAQVASLEVGRFGGASLARVLASQTSGPEKQLEAAAPADGSQARITAQFQLVDVAGKSGRPAALSLLLTARAGRWEVTAIEGTPLVQENSSLTAPSPEPSTSQSSPTTSPSPSPSGPGQ